MKQKEGNLKLRVLQPNKESNMTKIVLDTVSSGYNLGKINANFEKLETELNDKVLYRDQTSTSTEPNQVEQDLDFNSNRILNLPVPTSPTEPLRKGDITSDETGSTVQYVDDSVVVAVDKSTDITANRTDLLTKATKQAWVNRGYLKSDTGNSKFYIGFEHARYQSSEYRFYFNIDGFLLHEGSYTGESIGTYVLPDLTGSFTNSVTGVAYANTVSSSFTFDFTGTGFYFNAYTDTRGGLWNFSVDGGADIPISVWSATTNTDAVILVTNSLSSGAHTVVATYAGADPMNPPSSGGVGRGWMKYDHSGVGVSTAVLIPEIVGYPDAEGIQLDFSKPTQQALAAGTVMDFAIKVKENGSGLTPQWVPYHGGAGGAQDTITLEIIVDGLVISNDPTDLTSLLIFNDSVIFKQTYLGYNYEDPTTALFRGVIIHRFEKGVMTIDHTATMLEDTYCELGYFSGMYATQANVMDTIKYSNGFAFTPLSDWSGTSLDRQMAETPNSCCMQSSTTGAFSAISVDLVDALALGSSAQPTGNVFVQSRTSELIKSYWETFNDDTLSAGDVYRATTRYVMIPFVEIDF